MQRQFSRVAVAGFKDARVQYTPARPEHSRRQKKPNDGRYSAPTDKEDEVVSTRRTWISETLVQGTASNSAICNSACLPCCIRPTLWILPQRRGSKVLGPTTQFTRCGITVSTHLAASLARAIQVLICPDRERALASGPSGANSSIRRCDRLPSRSGNCCGMQIAPRTSKNVAI